MLLWTPTKGLPLRESLTVKILRSKLSPQEYLEVGWGVASILGQGSGAGEGLDWQMGSQNTHVEVVSVE